MKAAIFHGGKDIRVEDVPMPEPGAGEVQIKIMSAGICGSDLHPYRGHSPYGAREPHQRGHELAGEIAALDDGVLDTQRSDLVRLLEVSGQGDDGVGLLELGQRGGQPVGAERAAEERAQRSEQNPDVQLEGHVLQVI